jgi:hypothetical protein
MCDEKKQEEAGDGRPRSGFVLLLRCCSLFLLPSSFLAAAAAASLANVVDC